MDPIFLQLPILMLVVGTVAVTLRRVGLLTGMHKLVMGAIDGAVL